LWYTKGDLRLTFDIKIPTQNGCIFAVYLQRRGIESSMASVPKLSIQQAHQRFGHCNEDTTRQVAKALGVELTRGALNACEACSVAKAKQNNVTKESDHEAASRSNERVYLDLAKIKAKKGMSTPTRSIWCMIVDERTHMKFSSFHKTKAAMVEPTCELFDQWRQRDMPVDFVRLDNAGENKKLKPSAVSETWKLKIDSKFTARDTPQQNHLPELGFASIAGKGRALMIDANLPVLSVFACTAKLLTQPHCLTGLSPLNWMA
jgi:hypothetical protein